MHIFGRTIFFGDPQTVDIIIFDETNSQIVRKVLNDKYTVSIFKVRPEEIWVGLRVIVKFFRFISNIEIKDAIEHKKGFLVGILKQLQCVYFKSCLEVISPKAVITYIDNCSRFSWLSKNCQKLPFIGIQNGSRLSYTAKDNPSYYLQHLFCFGQHEVNLFPTLGYQVKNFYPVGSLIASLHFDHRHSKVFNKYDLLIVSTWRGNIGFPQDVKDTMKSMKIMDNHLAHYIKSREKKGAVIVRAERDSEHWVMPEIGSSEEEYYQEIYDNTIDIVETNFSKRNIFPLMQQSELIVSCLSSALLEAFGIGKKILYCNFTGTNMYHKDLDPSIVTDDCNFEAFSSKLDAIFKMPKEKYSRDHQERQKYYMSNPRDKATYQAISEKIDEIINKFTVNYK